MRRFALLLAACSSGSPAREDKAPPPAPPAPPRVIAPITGAHGGSITALAATADGGAAVTADSTGGVRLWPTLDGSREPIVVRAPVPAALAIARDGQGFAIAVTDAADHVVLIRLDNKGNVRARQALGAAEQIEIVGDGVLALRAEQVIDHIAFDGTLRGQLAPQPGTRIDSLVVNGSFAVAIVNSETQRYARRLELGAFAWGETSPLDILDGVAVMLTPDGKALIAEGADRRIRRFDFAGGQGKPACPKSMFMEGRRGGFDDEFGGFSRVGVENTAIGVVGDRVACLVDGTFSWFDVAKDSHTTANVNSVSAATMVVAGDRVIVGSDHQLVIATPDKIDYLGYGFRDLTHVRAVPTGLMIGKGDQEPVLLDDAFHERTRFALPKLRVDWTDIVPVDDRYIIVSSTRPGSGDLWGSAYQVAVYDSVKQVMHQVMPNRGRSGEIVFEPATNLLVATEGNKTMLMRFDPKARSLGGEVTLELDKVPKQIALLDPKLSGGVIALAIRDEGGGGLIVSELHGADLPPPPEDGKAPRSMRPRTTYRISGELRTVDRAGRLYVHNVMYANSVDIYVHGQVVANLMGAQAAKLRASPDARHVIAVEGGKLTLFTTAGKQLWETAAWGSSDVDWTATGTLFARFPHALVRIDAETGTLVERQCGWAFGISATPRDGSSNAPSVCDVAP